jgi:hypothetical protein
MTGATTVVPTKGMHQGDKEHVPGEILVHVDYISADEPIHRRFPETARLSEVKEWARSVFVPNPPSDKTFYMTDDKTRHRFTAQEEGETLAQLGYTHEAHLRLNEEQISGSRR